MSYSVIIIIISGLAFAVSHSLLANQRLKNRVYAWGLSRQRYRLCYVIIAVLLTTIWLVYIHRLPDQPLFAIDGTGLWLCYSIQAGGLIIFFLSLKPIDGPAFLGLRRFADDKEPFVEQGIYRYIRHPMYSGIMIILFAMPSQSYNSLTLYCLFSLYFVIGSRLEEVRMLKEHPEYNDYRHRVPAFIPHRWRPFTG